MDVEHQDAANGSEVAGSTVEGESQEDKVQRRLQEIKKQQDEIESGVAPELRARREQLLKAKNDRIASAQAHYAQQMECLRKMLEWELHEAEHVFKNSMESHKRVLLADLEEESRRVTTGRAEAAPAETRASTRKLRSKTRSEAEQAPRKKTVLTLAGSLLTECLAEGEIMADLRTIHSDWVERARQFVAEQTRDDIVVRGKQLCVGAEVLEVGSPVAVTSEVTNEPIGGVICSISPSEIMLQHSDGTRSRVYVAHLRQQRCTIQYEPSADIRFRRR